MKIHFAHRTFPWESEARGKAHVHCVIIGFGLGEVSEKKLYDYDYDPVNPAVSVVRNISPYLIEGNDTVATKRSKPIADVPPMVFGTKVVDDGHFVLDAAERADLLRDYPKISQYIRPFIGGEEFLNGGERWVLWLTNANPTDLRGCPPVMERIERVRAFRSASKKGPTVALALTPAAVGEDRQPSSDYLLFPKVSSERRRYVPLGFLSKDIVANGSALVVPNASIYQFGVLSSKMHMAWMRQTCGRMKSDYQYSVSIVYNNFPWPQSATEAQKAAVEKAAQAVLDARAQFMGSAGVAPAVSGVPPETSSAHTNRRSKVSGETPDTATGTVALPKQCTLADLYDPVAMPPSLAQAHTELDRAVDRCYRKDPFPSDRARVEYLFQLYEQLTAPLLPVAKTKRARRSLAR